MQKMQSTLSSDGLFILPLVRENIQAVYIGFSAGRGDFVGLPREG